MSSKTSVILDCGARRTALGVFRREGGRPRLEACATEMFPAASGPEVSWLDNTRIALAALRDRAQVSGPAVLVLPAHLVLTKFVLTPVVSAAKRRRIMQFEAAQAMPCDLAGLVWDHAVADTRPDHCLALLAAAKLEAVTALCTAAQAAGFEPTLLLPAPLATLAAFRLAEPSLVGPTLVLNFGERSTTLLLAEAERFVLRILPFGCHDSPRYGDGVPGGEAAELDAITRLAMRLTQEVTRTVLYFRRLGDVAAPVRVRLGGEGTPSARLAETLAARLQLPVEPLDVLAGSGTAAGAGPDGGDGHARPSLELIGAAATQLSPRQTVLNLLPPQICRREEQRRSRPWLLVAAVLAVSAPLAPVLHYRQVRDLALEQAAAMERELRPVRARDARMRVDLQQLAVLRGQVAALQGIHDRQDGWLRLLADLQERLVRAEDVWLEQLQVAPAAEGAPRRLQLAGCMLDQTDPLSRTGPEAVRRVKELLHDIAASPDVTLAEEGRRFDNSRPGILKFEFVLTARPERPL